MGFCSPRGPFYASAPAGQDDLSFAGYQKHLSSCAAPAPLTAAERELQRIRIDEVGAPDRLARGLQAVSGCAPWAGCSLLWAGEGLAHWSPAPR